MTRRETLIHQAQGQIVLTAVRAGRDAPGLEAVTAMRWRDSEGNQGQDSHVRLALHVERGGKLHIEVDGTPTEVTLEDGDRFLHTPGYADNQDADPILKLPTY